MKIAEVDVFQHDLPVRGPEKGVPYRMALQDVWHLDTTIVRLACDDGTVGYGETCPLGSTYQPEHALGARAALAEVVPHLIGLDPTAVSRVNSAMDEALMGHRYAKAAVDVACWDATGKAYGVRVCDLLGGAVRERVPSYHGVLIASPEDSAADADRRQAEGFPRIQLKVGGRPVAEDIAALRAVAATLRPGVRLSADRRTPGRRVAATARSAAMSSATGRPPTLSWIRGKPSACRRSASAAESSGEAIRTPWYDGTRSRTAPPSRSQTRTP